MPRGLEHKGRRPRRNGFGVNFPQKPLATHLLLSESDPESPEPLPELLACALPPLVRLTLPLPARRFIVSELRFVEIQRINLGIIGLACRQPRSGCFWWARVVVSSGVLIDVRPKS